MADWPYGTTAWQRLRKAKLAAEPLCQPCQAIGRLVTANTVDHVVSINAGGDPFPALDGLTSMCPACHNAKTAALDRADGKGIAIKGADAAGLPLDPSHPFHGGYTSSKDGPLGAPDRLWGQENTKFARRRRPWG